jgi:hypothetical protein
MFATLTVSLVLTSAAPARCCEPPPGWHADPVCQTVFFAVLEGLYTDGVPDRVVDAVVPRNPKDGANPVKTSFVVHCPLCQPVYEAFALYQKRPAFAGDAKRSAFGKGIEPELDKQLVSPDPKTRLTALKVLVQRWVGRRLTAMRLTDAEKAEWTAKLAARSGEGRGLLSKLLGTDPAYTGWSLYWGCAACNGTTAASREVQAERK